jgi:uncharacterized membrane protein
MRPAVFRRSCLWPCLVLLLAFAVRVWELDARALWLDEGMEYWVATSALPHILNSVRDGIQDPPLYSVLLHFWMRLGTDVFVLRYPSVCFGVVSVLGVMVIGHRLSGPAVGLAAGAVMAILPPAIRYSQEIGQYALMEALLVWSLFALQRIDRLSGWRAYALWGLLALLATYYYGTVLTLAATLGASATFAAPTQDAATRVRKLGAGVLYGIATIPLLVFFLPNQLFRGPTEQAFQVHLDTPMIEIKNLVSSTVHLVTFQLTGWPWTTIPEWIPVCLVVVAVILATINSIKGSARPQAWLAHLFLAGVLYYTASRLGLLPYGYRYGLILTPLLVPSIALGVAPTWQNRSLQNAGAFVLASIVIACALSLPHQASREALGRPEGWIWPETSDLDRVVAYWLKHRETSDPTYVYYAGITAFSYYVDQYTENHHYLPPTWYIECWTRDQPAYCTDNNIYYGSWVRHLEPETKVNIIRDVLPNDSESLWLIFSHVYPSEDQEILDGLTKDYQIVDSYKTVKASAYLLQLSAQSTKEP